MNQLVKDLRLRRSLEIVMMIAENEDRLRSRCCAAHDESTGQSASERAKNDKDNAFFE